MAENEELPQGGGMRIIGRAVPRKPVKTHIENVKSYLTPGRVEGVLEGGIRFVSGDSERLAWWLAHDRDYDGEEI